MGNSHCPERVASPTPPQSTPPRPWYRHPRAFPAFLIGLAIAFVAFSVPRYLTFDPAQAAIPDLRTDVPHYALLVAHVLFGAVAILAAPLQVWPGLRRRLPGLHRAVGRVYVVSVVVAGVLALAITPFSAGPAGNLVAAVLWIGTTLAGYRMARRRRFVEHRRWMVYSLALCMQIIWGRLMLFAAPLLPGYDPATTVPAVLETATWLGFVINLLVAQYFLERTERRKDADLTIRSSA